MNKKIIITSLLVLILLIFRICLGIQINFSHIDYDQIYLIGLEYVFNDNWSYWGPDVVWSKTRLPGAMQGFLAGFPIQLVEHPYSPIVFSNILSTIGLVLLALYGKKRFPSLNLNFLIALLLLLPFYLYHGVVLLNTAYLVFTGSLLFISVFELFIYREKRIFHASHIYFAIMGFSLLITYQLHLTWVLYIPFLLVLLYLEAKKDRNQLWKLPLFFILGAILPGLLLLPTVTEYGEFIYQNTQGNLNFDLARLGRIFELFSRYLSFATFDITIYNFIEISLKNSLITYIGFWIIKLFSVFQFIIIVVCLFFIKRTPFFKKSILLFLLTLIASLLLFTISNKHLSSRTYLLLYPIPIWLSFFVYDFSFRKGASLDFSKKFKTKFKLPLFWLKSSIQIILILTLITYSGIAWVNSSNEYSFNAKRKELKEAFKNEDPSKFGDRRRSLMDQYN